MGRGRDTRKRHARVAVASVVSALAAAAAPAAAVAAPPPSIDQYTETVPSGAGAKAQGIQRKSKARLSSKAASQLRRSGGSDAATLEKIATSSAYGAPAPISPSKGSRSSRVHAGKGQATEAPVTRDASRPSEAAADVLAAPSSGPSAWVFVTVAVTLAAALVAAAMWRFRRRISLR